MRHRERLRDREAEAEALLVSREPHLTSFLDDGLLRLDKNLAELELRREKLGANNWLYCGSDDGAHWNATVASLVASCQLHGIEPWAYLRDVFTLLPSWPAMRVLALAPKNWNELLEIAHILPDGDPRGAHHDGRSPRFPRRKADRTGDTHAAVHVIFGRDFWTESRDDSHRTSEEMHGGAVTRTATRRTVLIIWCVLMGLALGLTVVAAVAGPAIWPRVGDRGNPAAWVTFVMAPACLLASRVLPKRVTPPAGTAESIAVARSAIAAALNGGVALLAPLAWMVSGNPIALAALAISIVGLLLATPSQRRWQKLIRELEATSGRELGAAAAVSGPPPRSSRNVIALLAVIGLASAATLLLSGIFFWNEELLRRPSSPIVRALLVLMLASMLTGFAVLRLLGASASRHPRWQRAYGVLLLVLASYLLLQLVWML